MAAVLRSICREDAPVYRSPSSDVPSAQVPSASSPTDYPVERSLRQADALALSLRAGLDRIAIPLARAAAAFVQRQAWSDFGFARLEDHARERFGRSGRWVRNCASLGGALVSLPALAAALTGDDGGRPLGSVAALLVARVASADSLSAWIDLARRVPIRTLRDSVRAARAAGSDRPLESEAPTESEARSDSEARPEDGPTSPPDGPAERPASPAGLSVDAQDDLSDRALVQIEVPSPLLAAFDEVVDLYRCVEGREASVTSFVEALVGEACSAGLPPDADCRPMKTSPDPAVVETALARSTGNWSHLPGTSPASWSLALAGVSLARLREVERVAGTGGAAELDAQIRALLALEEDLDARLARILADLAERGAWARLRFAGVGHYAEERLGLSRTSAEDRVRAIRSLRQFRHLREAYEAGRVGFEATLIILKILGRGPVAPALERAWVARAEEATVKRLRDEARALGRTRWVRASGLAASSQSASSEAEPSQPAPPARCPPRPMPREPPVTMATPTAHRPTPGPWTTPPGTPRSAASPAPRASASSGSGPSPPSAPARTFSSDSACPTSSPPTFSASSKRSASACRRPPTRFPGTSPGRMTTRRRPCSQPGRFPSAPAAYPPGSASWPSWRTSC